MNKGLTQMVSCTLAATAEFEKTGKGLITHTCANTPASASFSENLTMEPAVLKWVSSGVPIHLSWPSSDPSLRRSGTPTMPMPLTNLYYGWE